MEIQGEGFLRRRGVCGRVWRRCLTLQIGLNPGLGLCGGALLGGRGEVFREAEGHALGGRGAADLEVASAEGCFADGEGGDEVEKDEQG